MQEKKDDNDCKNKGKNYKSTTSDMPTFFS